MTQTAEHATHDISGERRAYLLSLTPVELQRETLRTGEKISRIERVLLQDIVEEESRV